MFLRILLILSISGTSYCLENSGWHALVQKSIQAANFETLYKALASFPEDLPHVQCLVSQLREEGEIQVGGQVQHLLYDLAEELQRKAKER